MNHNLSKIITLTALISFFGLSNNLNAKSKKNISAVEYFTTIFGHVHQNPSNYSESLSAISCGHPIKIISKNDNGWANVVVGPYKGYIRSKYLASKRPLCFQDKYPKFFEQFELDLSDLYYWGKLSDQYVQGKSKLK